MKIRKLLIASIGAVVLGCGGSSSGGADRLGAQIDSMGRAAVNTAVIMTFTSNAERGAAQDDYNVENNFNRTRFVTTIAQHLAIYDALVGECGSNPVTNRASANPADGLATGAGRYNFMATVLADDHLYLNANSAGASGGACNQYLAAELGVIGVQGFEGDCGGRTPPQDVIEATYSLVAIGAVTGVNDGLTSDNVAHSLTEFPFLAPAL